MFCQIRCSLCPSSNVYGNTFVCNCPNYAREGNCKHIHVVALLLVCPSPHVDHDYCGTMGILQPYDVSEDADDASADDASALAVDQPTSNTTLDVECSSERREEEPEEELEKAFSQKLDNVWSDVRLRLTSKAISLDVRETMLKSILGVINPGDPNGLTAFPKLDNQRKRERFPSLFPKHVRKRKQKKTLSEPVTLRKELLQQCVKAPLNDVCWMYLLALDKEGVLCCAMELETEEKPFLEMYDNALAIWMCAVCNSVADIEKNLSGYILCDVCQQWVHGSCANVNQSDIEESDDEIDWICPTCRQSPNDL